MFIGGGVTHREFRGTAGGSEHFISVTVPNQSDLGAQLDRLEDRYSTALRDLQLSEETAVMRRLFVSDVINQAAAVRSRRVGSETPDNPVAISLVQQPPADGSRTTLLAYHADTPAPAEKKRLSPHHLLVTTNGRRHLYTTGLCAAHASGPPSAKEQARIAFDALVRVLGTHGANLRDNCVRTWLYLKDVDVFYQGMVDARRDVFAEEGLTRDTHFIASTGIEGACGHQLDVVAMDACSILDLEPGALSYLNDYDRLCPTADYNVHFERGTTVTFVDRAHHFISGTASIDKMGRVVHEGDVMRQLDRAVSNVEALLRSAGAGLRDLTHLIVYLRDSADFGSVRECVTHIVPGLPAIIVQAAVCRPQWLVEVEGIAITHRKPPTPIEPIGAGHKE